MVILGIMENKMETNFYALVNWGCIGSYGKDQGQQVEDMYLCYGGETVS